MLGTMTPTEITFDATKHPVSAVTVFQADRAEVRRLINVELKGGQNHIVIDNLPSCLIQDSIRADGTGNATILDVIYKAPRIGGPREETEASLELEALVEERATLAAKWDRLDSRTRVLTSYSKTLNGESTEPETLEKFLDMLETNEEAIYLGRAALNRQVKVVDKKLKALRDSMTASEAEGSVKRRTRVTVVVIADVDGPGELNLSYVISGALWTPFYDLRARLSHTKKEDSTITVHYRASIRQATGEDWKDVALTLSTASPFVGTSLPTLDPVRIVPQSTALGGFPAFGTKSANTNVGTGFGGFGGTAPQQPQPFVQAPMAQQQQQQPRPASLFGTVASPSTAPTVFSFPASAASAPSFGHSAAVANGEGLGNATLSIRGLSTIPSSSWEKSQTHKVTITEVDLVAELEWSVVPKKSRDAFLLCRAKNTSQFVFLPGSTNIFMDGNFVAKSDLKHVSPQEYFSCSLGIDSAIKVEYHPFTKKAATTGNNWTGSKADTTVYTQRTTIKNTRQAALRRLIIRDQVPVSEDSTIKVAVLEPNSLGTKGSLTQTPPTAKDGVLVQWESTNDDGSSKGDDGVVKWRYDTVEAGATLNTTLSWEISAPPGVKWNTIGNFGRR